MPSLLSAAESIVRNWGTETRPLIEACVGLLLRPAHRGSRPADLHGKLLHSGRAGQDLLYLLGQLGEVGLAGGADHDRVLRGEPEGPGDGVRYHRVDATDAHRAGRPDRHGLDVPSGDRNRGPGGQLVLLAHLVGDAEMA